MSNTITINEEELETYSNDDLFNITSWGADLSFRELAMMYDEGELLKPELQRKYVWTKKEASRFIDSVLLGLPIPSIFLAKQDDERMLIIDGYQRIMTIYDFMKGNKFQGDDRIFSLFNSDIINQRWRGKQFSELSLEEQRKIKSTTIHAIIFEQKHPQDDTGMYQIFERINTSGAALKPQEIRNCVYQGKFNSLLFELNKETSWRNMFGSEIEDQRMYDLELILRFFAISDLRNNPEKEQNSINLLKYLNNYMGKYRNLEENQEHIFRDNFMNMINLIKDILGENAFKRFDINKQSFVGRITPAAFDAISSATLYAKEKGFQKDSTKDYTSNYKNLLQNEQFIDSTSNRTTKVENIRKRISIASQILYGIDYEF
jgi:hypothetical protein